MGNGGPTVPGLLSRPLVTGGCHGRKGRVGDEIGVQHYVCRADRCWLSRSNICRHLTVSPLNAMAFGRGYGITARCCCTCAQHRVSDPGVQGRRRGLWSAIPCRGNECDGGRVRACARLCGLARGDDGRWCVGSVGIGHGRGTARVEPLRTPHLRQIHVDHSSALASTQPLQRQNDCQC